MPGRPTIRISLLMSRRLHSLLRNRLRLCMLLRRRLLLLLLLLDQDGLLHLLVCHVGILLFAEVGVLQGFFGAQSARRFEVE
jgi:hypothetical protein